MIVRIAAPSEANLRAIVRLALRMLRSLLIASLLAAPLAAQTPAEVAALVDETDGAKLSATLTAAIASPNALTRATAARVATIRNVPVLLPLLRERLPIESDTDAAREETRALVILGEPADVDLAIAATRKLPRGIDFVIAQAAARRGDAFELVAKLRAAKIDLDASFMILALWQRPVIAAGAGARFVGRGDAASWRALLNALRQSTLVMPAGVLAASLNSSSEEIRTASVWYLVHGYAGDPAKIDPLVSAALASPKEEASTREAFGRELLHRMSSAEKKSDAKWLEWLQSLEADELIESEETLFAYFTDDEFLTRKRHCDMASNDCRVPSARPAKIKSVAVRQPDFQLPAVLPPGLADAVVDSTHCRSSWLALAEATADRAGRVEKVTLNRLMIDDACARAVTTLMKLSLAAPSGVTGSAKSFDNLLVRADRASPCLDEAPLGDAAEQSVRPGGDVKVPVVKRRVEPHFPASARRAMAGRGGANVMVIVEAVISQTGCVRSLRLIAQSPFPELNGAAVEALSQWTFAPGRMHGVPVDVIFNLTINFKVP
jgi:TonB family protein